MEKWTKEQLKDKAAKLKLPVSGTKDDIIERLKLHETVSKFSKEQLEALANKHGIVLNKPTIAQMRSEFCKKYMGPVTSRPNSEPRLPDRPSPKSSVPKISSPKNSPNLGTVPIPETPREIHIVVNNSLSQEKSPSPAQKDVPDTELKPSLPEGKSKSKQILLDKIELKNRLIKELEEEVQQVNEDFDSVSEESKTLKEENEKLTKKIKELEEELTKTKEDLKLETQQKEEIQARSEGLSTELEKSKTLSSTLSEAVESLTKKVLSSEETIKTQDKALSSFKQLNDLFSSS